MIKAILVDDELLARNYIRGLADWGGLGFEIAGEAGNGIEALRLIREVSPQLVLADIHMAGMDGVELCKRIAEMEEEIRMIVVSSYDDYDYVRETLRHGAVDYLLKHRLDGPSLSALLEKVKHEIEVSNRHRLGESFLEKNWEHMNLELSRRYLKELALGTEEEADAAVQYFVNLSPIGTVNIMTGAMQVMNYYLLTESLTVQERMKLSRSILDMSGQHFDGLSGIAADLEQGKFLYLFSFGKEKSEYAMMQQIHAFAGRLERSLYSFLNITVVFGTFQPVRGFADVKSGIEKSDKSLDERVRQRWIGAEPPPGAAGAATFTLTLSQERELQLALEKGDETEMEAIVRSLFAAMKDGGASPQSVQLTVSELVNLAEKVWRKSGGKDAFFEGGYLTRGEVNRVDRLDDIRDWTLSLFESLLRKLPKSPETEGGSAYVAAAKRYVMQNYRRGISLEDAADYAGITASYLSRLFKQQEGVNFTDYLNRIRIKHAKQLLRLRPGSARMKQISQEVGFSSHNYFSKVFKDVTGMTPHVYSQRAEAESCRRGEAR